MNKKYKTSLFWFRRDLRLADNTGLLEALDQSEEVVPCFIFNPEQLEKSPNKNRNAIQFMLKSLTELDLELANYNSALNCFYGDPTTVVPQILEENKVDAIFFNRDYTPFARRRGERVHEVCKKQNVDYVGTHDVLLIEPQAALKSDKTPYTVFTPFFKNAIKQKVREVNTALPHNYQTSLLLGAKRIGAIALDFQSNSNLAMKGGRTEALGVLSRMKNFGAYDSERDLPALSATTKLSAHHKFGTVSIREVYAAVTKTFSDAHTLVKELYWRDFFTHVGFHFPHVFNAAFHKHYDALKWENDEEQFAAWCEGRTGFPIVDAGMRELNTTGFMHNRVRMIVASFLTKDLLIDWRWGEKYFAKQLVDYDAAVNNGNWQWASSTGCDAQPYFRIFNPWLQQKKFDVDCKYIKRWVPELKDLSPAQIHLLHEENVSRGAYPTPIVDHRAQKELAEDMYNEVLSER